MTQEVRTQDWVLYVCNNENPAKCTAESEVEGEGTCSKSRDGRVVGSP